MYVCTDEMNENARTRRSKTACQRTTKAKENVERMMGAGERMKGIALVEWQREKKCTTFFQVRRYAIVENI